MSSALTGRTYYDVEVVTTDRPDLISTMRSGISFPVSFNCGRDRQSHTLNFFAI